MFCSNCGAKIYDGEAFCPECGQKVELFEETMADSVPISEAVPTEESAMEAVAEAVPTGESAMEAVAEAVPTEENNIESVLSREEVSVEATAQAEIPAQAETPAQDETPEKKKKTGKKQKKEKKEKKQKAGKKQKKEKKQKNKALFILLIFLEVGLLGACGYGIYRFWQERTNAQESADELQAELDRADRQERKAKKEKKEQEELERQRQEQERQIEEAREQSKQELLTALDNAIKVVTDSKESDSEESAKKLLEDFRARKAKYNELTGMEGNLYDAGKESLDLMERVLESDVEYFRLISDVMTLCDNLDAYVELDPRDYAYLDSFLEDAEEILEEIENGYEAISSPSYVKDWWGQVGEQINILGEVGYRGAESVFYEDVLRYYSFLTLKDHVTEKLIQKLYEYASIRDHEDAYYADVYEDALALYGKVSEVAKLPYEQRQAYVFPSYQGELVIKYDSIDVIYPTLYNAIDFFAILNLGCVKGQRDVVVEFEIPGLTQVQKQSCHVGEDMTTIYLKPPATTALTDLSTVKNGQMRLVVSDKSGEVIETHSVPVRIMSQYDFKWYNDEFGYVSNNNILCFMTPEANCIAELKREAINQISDMTNGGMSSFPGYQNAFGASEGYEFINTYLQAAGVMRALSEMNVRYNMDVFSSSGEAQHIMLPEDVLKYKSGLCIETSLVVASALQSAGLHTYILLPDSHAQVAVEAWGGLGEYFLIETTMLPNDESPFVNYGNMLLQGNYTGDGLSYLSKGYPIVYLNDDAWEEYVQEANVLVIDCADSSLLGSTPFVR